MRLVRFLRFNLEFEFGAGVGVARGSAVAAQSAAASAISRIASRLRLAPGAEDGR